MREVSQVDRLIEVISKSEVREEGRELLGTNEKEREEEPKSS